MAEPAPPRLLLLETSGRAGFVAAAQGRQLLAQRRISETRRQARDLAPSVAELLQELAWRPTDVQAVVISRGPGSYTGLRVGIMSARIFAYATGCELVAVDTFAVIASQTAPGIDQVDVLADAQQENVYVQSFGRQGGHAEPLGPLAIRTFEDWLSLRPVQAWVSGPGLHRWASRLPGPIPRIEETLWDPQPQSLLQLGLEGFHTGTRADLWTLEPLYLRPSAAEQQWDARGGPR